MFQRCSVVYRAPRLIFQTISQKSDVHDGVHQALRYVQFSLFYITEVCIIRTVQPVATCRQSPYLSKPAIVIVTSFSL